MSPIHQRVSENLKAIRKERKLSQQDIAERCGILASTYNRVENMKVSPSLETLERISTAIEIPFEQLFQPLELSEQTVVQKLGQISELSEYNQSVINILFDALIDKDKLEKAQQVKLKKRLDELNSIRKEH